MAHKKIIGKHRKAVIHSLLNRIFLLGNEQELPFKMRRSDNVSCVFDIIGKSCLFGYKEEV